MLRHCAEVSVFIRFDWTYAMHKQTFDVFRPCAEDAVATSGFVPRCPACFDAQALCRGATYSFFYLDLCHVYTNVYLYSGRVVPRMCS